MDLYSEIILDHFKKPQNKGSLTDATASAHETNPLCGDKMFIELKVDEAGIITDIAFEGEGCAISQASASLLTEELKGKPLIEVKNLDNELMYELLGVPISPGRVKCALLALSTAKKAAILAEHTLKNTEK